VRSPGRISAGGLAMRQDGDLVGRRNAQPLQPRFHIWRVDGLQAGRDLEASSPAHNDQPYRRILLESHDQGLGRQRVCLRVADRLLERVLQILERIARTIGADQDVQAADGGGDAGGVEYVHRLPDDLVAIHRDGCFAAGDGGDVMAARQRLGNDALPDIASGADDADVHRDPPASLRS
jgi:hypothetical protein